MLTPNMIVKFSDEIAKILKLPMEKNEKREEIRAEKKVANLKAPNKFSINCIYLLSSVVAIQD